MKNTKKWITLQMSLEEIEQLKILATKHTGGNVSLWLRTAGLKYRPKSK